MAAILDPEQTTDFKALAQGIKKALPSYARPIFIRMLRKMDLTGTIVLKVQQTSCSCFFLKVPTN